MLSYLKKLPKLILLPALGMLAGYLLLVLVYCIPTDWILPQVAASNDILQQQGETPDLYFEGGLLDNWTEASCLSVTYNVSSGNPFFNALNAFHYIPGNKERVNGLDYLQTTLGGDKTHPQDHSYLWHGFRIWLRVLLVFCKVDTIRSILFLITTLLLTLLCVLLVRLKKSPLAFLPFLLAVGAYGLQAESFSFLYFHDFCLGVAASIAVLIACLTGREDRLNAVFCVAGFMMAFFSMLMLPLLGLGFPLIVWAITAQAMPERQKLGRFLQYNISWGLGYGLTMGIKILISVFFISSGLGLERVTYYSGNGLIGLKGRLWRVVSVFGYALQTMLPRVLALAAVLLLAIAFLRRRRAAALGMRRMLPAWAVALYPAAWCFFMYGHAEHYFTRWNYAMALFALLQTVWEAYDMDARLARQKWWTGA